LSPAAAAGGTRLAEVCGVQANPFYGVALHAAGGLAAGSFYLPFRGVRQWA